MKHETLLTEAATIVGSTFPDLADRTPLVQAVYFQLCDQRLPSFAEQEYQFLRRNMQRVSTEQTELKVGRDRAVDLASWEAALAWCVFGDRS